ncbi:hypothetical protein CVIRNUC_001228 [Coccomyxa viridis]|uniref:Two-component response regulator n=1 Tax=Coccomyxa viridis TaxID=1274662 RepID=A0AAV1HTG6_9CHLO|nr:hypothetical protein CVIRNUC_001228 [Coccomyxa viridis]
MAREELLRSDSFDVFPAGLRVLVVDDDALCLKVVEHMLRRCNYIVETCVNGKEALKLLRDKDKNFDLVLSDVYMPDMDGFRLLEQVGLEMDIPVIMMSSNGETSVVLRGVTHGAVDFLIKPVRVEELRNVWQHVVRRRKDKELQPSKESDEEGTDDGKQRDKKRKERRDSDEATTAKKQRVVWSVEMHQQFVAAVNQLGIDKAVPKRILDIMNVDNLTRENVASHLQKYRLYLKRMSGLHPGQNGRKGSGKGSSGSHDANFQMMMAASGMQPAMMPGAMPSMAGSAAPAHELMQQMHMQRMGLSQMPPGMMPPVGVMPPPPMAVNGDFMAMQMGPGMPGSLPGGPPRSPWPGASMPVVVMPGSCSTGMVTSMNAEHPHPSAGNAFPMPGRDLPFLDAAGGYGHQPEAFQHGLPNGLHCSSALPTPSLPAAAHPGFEIESLEPDFLMDNPLMEASMPMPQQHPGHPLSDSMPAHMPNGSLDHMGLDSLHDLSGGDEDYKRMLQMLVPPTLPTSSLAFSFSRRASSTVSD